MHRCVLPLSLLLLLAVAFAAGQEEDFVLKDGRRLTGVYDQTTHEILFNTGRIKGSVTVAPEDIVSRKPAAQNHDPVSLATEQDVLHLADGRVLRGVYDEATATLYLLGKIRGAITIKPEAIASRSTEPLPPMPTGDRPPIDRTRILSDEISQLTAAIRDAEAELVRLADASAALAKKLPVAETAASAAETARDQAEQAYRNALAERDAGMAGQAVPQVPEAIQQALVNAQTTYKTARSDAARSEIALASLKTEAARLQTSARERRGEIAVMKEKIEELQHDMRQKKR